MRSTAARAVGAAAVLAGGLLLAGCDKPAPQITVQTGAFSTTISPSLYCFDPTHCRGTATPKIKIVTAKVEARILVDVPRDLVGRGWVVVALSLDGTKVLGGSPAIHDSHSYAVAASTNNGDPFIVQIDQLHHGKPDGSKWSFLVQTSNAT